MAETVSEDVPPHADAHAAGFVDGDGHVYALVGEIIRVEDEAGAMTHHLLVGEGLARPIDHQVLPLFEFFRTPRSQSQAEEWLDWAGAPAGYLRELVKLKLVIAVDARRHWPAAKSLRGLKLFPQSEPGAKEDNGYIGLMSEPSKLPVMYVSPELAAVLWGNERGEDVTTLAKRIARATGLDRDRAARRVLAAIPMLLQHGFARLEWLRVPNV